MRTPFIMRTPFVPLAALVLAFALPALPAAAAEGDEVDDEAGWYVLRDRASGDCWAGRLIRIAGQLASGTNQVAGGPFADREAAEAHRATLVERSTCAED